MSERTTAGLVASHRLYVIHTIIPALRAAFDASYNRDPQLNQLRIAHDYPLKQIDYPTIVVEYENRLVANAGVGHEEWFVDQNNQMHKWYHSRFEGQMNFDILALTPLDRDLLADALTEVIRFGRLDSQLVKFFNTVYGDPAGPVMLWFNQIMLNTDEISSSGNTVSLAPWQTDTGPALQIYETQLSMEIHGGYYNVNPDDLPKYVTSVELTPYSSSDETVVLDLTQNWTNPFSFYDSDVVSGKAVIAGSG